MTWEETIRFIRTQEDYRELVEQSYLDENLRINVERFRSSREFEETLKIIKTFMPNAKEILDIGAGNGISSVAFSVKGYNVTAAEPDTSDTVGSGAIRILKNEMNLSNLKIINSYGEKLPFDEAIFDVVYIRQAMHHANDLDAFIKEASRVLKPGGLLLTIRDHIIYGKKDKELFLRTHPLQKFYGGENAFTFAEYSAAMHNAELHVVRRLKYYESPINYFPAPESEILDASKAIRKKFKLSIQKRFGSWAVNFPFLHLLELISIIRNGKWMDERRVPGRMNSFIAIKNSL